MAVIKKLGGVLLLVVVAGLGYHYYTAVRDAARASEGGPGMRGRGETRPVAVETAPVRRMTVRESSAFSGSLSPSAEFTVAPRISGRLRQLHVDLGDAVTNGQLIAVIDDEEYAQQVEQARAERGVAEATLAESISAYEIAVRDLERVTRLHQQGVVSDSERDAAQSKYDAVVARRRVAKAQRDQRDALLAAARIRLAYTRIHAAWENDDNARVVGERYVHQGAMLSVGQPIVSILDIDQLTAVLHVVERDYPRIAIGQTARIVADALPGETFTGTVVRVAPRVEDRSRQARVEIALDNPEHRLRPGMFVRAEIVFKVTEDACVVPAQAVVRREGDTGVFQVDPESGTANFIRITPGAGDRDVIQVLDPPLSGRVVVLGQHLLDDGRAVHVRNDEDTSP